MNKSFPFPKRYWIYIGAVLVCAFLLIGNVFRTDSWTGDKPFSEFVQRDWILLAVFLLEEIIIVLAMFLFSVIAGKISKMRDKEILQAWEQVKYSGVKPEDYDYVWFDFYNSERALILKQGDVFNLYVEEYNARENLWKAVNQVSIYESLDLVKSALFYDFDFFCRENAELDEHSDEIYKEA